MTSEKRAQEFHTYDASLLRSAWVVLLIGWIKFPTRHDHSMETNHSWWRPSEADMEFTLPKTRIESQSRKYKLRKTLSWQSSTTDFIPRHFATSVIHIQVIQASSATRACGVEGYLGTWTLFQIKALSNQYDRTLFHEILWLNRGEIIVKPRVEASEPRLLRKASHDRMAERIIFSCLKFVNRGHG